VKLKLLGAAAILCSLAFFALLAYASLHAIDLRARERYGMELRRLDLADGELDKLVLKARLGMLGHYDPLVAMQREIDDSLDALSRTPAFYSSDDRAGLERARQRAAGVFASKHELVERFKSQHAAFRNSARYLPVAVSTLLSLGPPAEVREAASSLLGIVSKFVLSSEASLREQTGAQLAALEKLSPSLSRPELVASMRQVLLHARILYERKPVLDELIERVLSQSTASEVDALETRHARYYQAAIARAEARRLWLFVLAFVSLGSGASYVALRFRLNARALADALVKLEQANQKLREEGEQERELHALKSRFAARTSHEFRTPLSIIMSSSEMLANYGQRLPDKKREEHRARIESAIRDMTDMLDDILAAWREDGGERSFAPERVDVVPLCQAAAAQVADAMQSAERVLVQSRSERLEADVDPRLVRHILTNLLSNAIKYSARHERVVLDVRERGDSLLLTVSDRGRGIPEEDQVHLFEDFHRGSNVEEVPGTGLGLAVARRAAEIHGGSISVESRVGEGSTFVVCLPRFRTTQATFQGARP
jgi:signal transduction histidine kinase